MKAKLSILTILFLYTFLSSAQNHAIWIKGKITSSETGEPLQNVNIRVKDTYRGTLSDQFGYFKIALYKMPSTLIFSHVGFHTSEKSFTVEPLQKLEIVLEKKTEQLEEFVVTSNRIDTVYISRRYAVLDYELWDEKIILLIYRNNLNRAEILLLDENNKEVSSIEVLPEKPEQLIKDCFGNIHIITKTKVYQIYPKEEQLLLYPSVNKDIFREIMGNCEFIVGNRLYYQNFEYQNLITNYFYIDTALNERNRFRMILDQQKVDYLAYNPEFYMGDQILVDNVMGDNDPDKQRALRTLDAEKRFHLMAYLTPVFAPMKKMGDSICIFNHPQSVIEFYDANDSLVGETPIEYHHQVRPNNTFILTYAFYKSKKWQEEIYIDDEARKAYTLFVNNNGSKELVEIDLNSGRLKYSMKIPFPYVEKIKVRDGFVYFLYKGWGEMDKKKLFRQSID
jgi:hypothetical protein